MTNHIPRRLVSAALSRGELSSLLVADPKYRFVPFGSPAPGDTDLTVLLDELYKMAAGQDRAAIVEAYTRALAEIVDRYEGIEPTASAIMFEALRRARSRNPLHVDFTELAKRLRRSIANHRVRLAQDVRNAGRGWPDGLLGDLRRLSRITVELGGPSFFEEKLGSG